MNESEEMGIVEGWRADRMGIASALPGLFLRRMFICIVCFKASSFRDSYPSRNFVNGHYWSVHEVPGRGYDPREGGHTQRAQVKAAPYCFEGTPTRADRPSFGAYGFSERTIIGVFAKFLEGDMTPEKAAIKAAPYFREVTDLVNAPL